MAKEKKIKIKIMHQIGSYEVGQEVEVSQAEADVLCAARTKHDGHAPVTWYPAMTFETIEELKSKAIDQGGLTQDELEAMGMRNIVINPPDPAFDKKLAAIENGEFGLVEKRDELSDKNALKDEQY